MTSTEAPLGGNVITFRRPQGHADVAATLRLAAGLVGGCGEVNLPLQPDEARRLAFAFDHLANVEIAQGAFKAECDVRITAMRSETRRQWRLLAWQIGILALWTAVIWWFA